MPSQINPIIRGLLSSQYFRLFLFAHFIVGATSLYPEGDASKYLVFVGEKISLSRVQPNKDEIPFDYQFLAKYRVLEVYRGSYAGDEIEFTVFDHYGTPGFSEHKHVLLYLEKHDGHFFHSKYQFTPLYKTRDGKWAGAYAAMDYSHSFNENTKIKPEKIEFLEPVTIDISKYESEDIARWFPEPYFQIKDQMAIAVYGNYIDELFKLKQDGVLKARGDFQ